jgi:hypothetical protein
VKEDAMSATRPGPAGSLATEERRALETEIAALRERLRQREAALTVLNRRLVTLERFDGPPSTPVPSDAEARARAAEEELERMRQTRTFRWTSSARGVYRQLRRLAGQ